MAHLHQLAIVRPKVVAPFGDAVSLVDGQAIHTAIVEHEQRFRPQQCLRRGIEQFDSPGANLLHDDDVAVIGQGAVEIGGRHARLAQLHHLVFHEGDERRDDDRQAGEEQGGQLEAH